MANLLRYKDQPEAQSVLLYGAPFTGKTHMLGELAKEFNVLWIDLDNGKSTLLASLPDDALERIEYIHLKDTPQNPCAVLTLLSMFESTAPGWICEKHSAWNCLACRAEKANAFQIDLTKLTPANNWVIVVDSGTQFAQSGLMYVCQKKNISFEDGDKASFTIWNMQGMYINKLFSMIQQGNNHVAVTAHEFEVQMPDKTKKIVASIGTRAVATNFGKYFDNMIRLAKIGTKHEAYSLTTDAPQCETGSRFEVDIRKPDTTICDFFKLPANVTAGGKVTNVASPALGQAGLSKYAPPKT